MRDILGMICFAFIFAFGSSESAQSDDGPLSFPKWQALSTEYTRVQTADWLGDDHFVVGRWDGSIAAFRKPQSGEITPVLTDIWRTQDGSGVEMVQALDDDKILASDGASALAIWTLGEKERNKEVPYDPSFGVANSAVRAAVDGDDLVVTGHANGHLLIWLNDAGNLKLRNSIDLSSPDPIPSPFPLKNIRGLALWAENKVVAGSEDGDLTIINLSTEQIEFRQRYNPDAQRGINSISVLGDYLLVANCSVGQYDKNLWLFSLGAASISLLDAIDLKDDLSRPQSFNFDSDLVRLDGKLHFFASTEEGLLWAGKVEKDRLVPTRPSGEKAESFFSFQWL